MGTNRKSWSKAEILELIACKRKKLSIMKTWTMCLAKGIECSCDDMIQQWKDMLSEFRLIYNWETDPCRTMSYFDMDMKTRSDKNLPRKMDKIVYRELVRFEAEILRPSRFYHSGKRRRRRAKSPNEESDNDSRTDSMKSDVQEDAQGTPTRGKRILCALNEAVVESDRTNNKSRKLTCGTSEAEAGDAHKAEDEVAGASAIDQVELLVADPREQVEKQETGTQKAVEEIVYQHADSKPWNDNEFHLVDTKTWTLHTGSKPWTVDNSQAPESKAWTDYDSRALFRMEEPMPSAKPSELLFQDIDHVPVPEPLHIADEEFDAEAFADGFLTLQEEETKPTAIKTPEKMSYASATSSNSWTTQRKLEIEQQKNELLMRANLLFVMAMSQLSAAVNQLSQKL